MRIVDKYGKPVKINKIVPAFNEEQMLKQKEAFNNNNITEINKFRQNYNYTDKNNINNNNINMITANVNKYPDDVFADRITNYKYLDNNQNIQIIDQSKQNNNKNINKVIQKEIIENEKQIILTKNKYNNKNNKNNNNNNKKENTKIYNNLNLKGTYIQIGIYNKRKNAETAYKKYSNIHNGNIEEYISKSKVQYKVLLGPYFNKKTAEKDLEKVIKTGHYDVYITEKK